MGTLVHIIGGGLAGLACAVEVIQAGGRVRLLEGSPTFGGRCRSFYDPTLERTLDTGSHLMLAANGAVRSLAQTCGGDQALVVGEASFPFIDLHQDKRWTLSPSPGRLPWWLFDPKRRDPSGSLWNHLGLLRLCWASVDQTVAQILRHHPLYRSLIDPLTVAILNTPSEYASARLLGNTLRETLFAGGEACRPLFAPQGLSAALVEPVVAWLQRHGAEVCAAKPVRSLERNTTGQVCRYQQTGEGTNVHPGDAVVVALPPLAARRLLPEVPEFAHQRIANFHFRAPYSLPATPLVGVLGGESQWIFCRGDVVSITISAASRYKDAAPEAIWREIEQVFGFSGPFSSCPPLRMIQHHQATIEQTPQTQKLRQSLEKYPIILAGDCYYSALPCTLEAAVRSGKKAARRALGLSESR